MNYENACSLCLEKLPTQAHIDIYSEESKKINVAGIVFKHLGYRFAENPQKLQQICEICWKIISDFHNLYNFVTQNVPVVAKSCLEDDDPLPHEVFTGESKISSASLSAILPENNFFCPEIKIEEHELDQLPKIEVIENVTEIEPEAPKLRISRRIRSVRSFKDEKNTVTLDEECGLTRRKKEDNIEKSFSPDPKKRRGRPRKEKEDTQTDNSVEGDIEKIEQVVDSDSRDVNLCLSFMETASDETSDSNETESFNTESEDSSQEKYAIIPKRVVVRPKKYKKRPKPLIPPVRMSREELERRKAQQEEYDEIIAKFFNNKFPCPICNLLVQNFADMCRHHRITHNIDPGYMNCCGRKFTQRKALAEHVLVHWNPDHFKCTTCLKVFQNSRLLETHAQAHMHPEHVKDKVLFQCDKCPKTFTSKSTFEYHNLSKHLPKSEFKFACPQCNKKLLTERKLKNHLKAIHDPENAIICDKCGKQMRTKHSLKKHQELMHSDTPRPEPVLMQCQICGTWLKNQSGLKQHMKSIHIESKGEHRCHICNKISPNARALRRHIYHNHECERKFKCTMCEKAFKRPQELREHTSTHTGEVLYTCPNCPMTFFCSANMYKHRQRLHREQYEADRNQPRPPNILQQAVGATAAMKMKMMQGVSSAALSDADSEIKYF